MKGGKENQKNGNEDCRVKIEKWKEKTRIKKNGNGNED
jgi:hypothetical protein